MAEGQGLPGGGGGGEREAEEEKVPVEDFVQVRKRDLSKSDSEFFIAVVLPQMATWEKTPLTAAGILQIPADAAGSTGVRRRRADIFAMLIL